MKKIIIIAITFLVSLLCIGYSLLSKDIVKESGEIIYSSVILDSSFKIKIILNEEEKVIRVTALNEEAKELIKDSFKDNTLNETLDKIIKKISYNDIDVTINTDGDIKKEEVKEILENIFVTYNINGKIM